MKVHLTFDVEVWCGSWNDLDGRFPAAFDRYVYGRSARGEFALPATLEIMARHGLKGTFFVEPLFSARFGAGFLARIVQMIESAGQDVQLHLHPEWTDELPTPPIRDASRKRQHLYHYSADEQVQLLKFGLDLLREQSRGDVRAFRAGSYAANADTYRALRAAGLEVDSSLNRACADSGLDVPQLRDPRSAFEIDGVRVVPVTVFQDGRGRDRPAQVGSCGLLEMIQALDSADRSGRGHFVFVSHNFEMLKPGRSDPDPIVVRRFEGLCRHLAAHRDRFDTCPIDADVGAGSGEGLDVSAPRAGFGATMLRLAAQAARRLG